MEKRLYPALPVLLIDDEQPWLCSLALALKGAVGISNVITCYDGREAMGILEQQPVSLILLDLTMPHLGGDELLPLIVQEHPGTPVIILTGMNQLEMAVTCMRKGAFDYFVKTTEEERLMAGVRRALEVVELQRENQELSSRILGTSLHHPEVFARIVTGDRKMQSIFRYVEAVAPSREAVLITGESGVGKELVARAIHRLGRPDAPWVAINVAGLDDQVFADTLFGHVRGAFTGAERARGGMLERVADGTLFLDEIGDLSLASQVKLLRVLQEGEYFPVGSDAPHHTSARLVFATNQDLEAKIAVGQFRKDLYFRLCSHHIHIPPLRERRDDLSLLLDFFSAEAAKSLGKATPASTSGLVPLLKGYPFPGNVRELRAMVYDAVSVHRRGALPVGPFRKAFPCSGPAPCADVSGPSAEDVDSLYAALENLPTLKDSTRLLVTEALRRSGGNQTVAAGLLGVSQQALSQRLKKSQD